MKSKFLAIIFAAFVWPLSGCEEWGSDCVRGQGAITTRTIEPGKFHSLELNATGNVRIMQGERQEVVVEGQENLIDLVSLRVKDNLWEIEFTQCVSTHNELTFYVTIPDIRYLGIAGSGSIRTTDRISAENLSLSIAGSGSITAEVEAESIAGNIAGSGDIELQGSAAVANFNIAGSGDVKAFDLPVDDCHVNVAGSGNAEVSASEFLEVEIAGSGNVAYKGSPVVEVAIAGSGVLINAN